MDTNYEKITESLDLVSKRLQHSLGDPVRLYAPESLRNRRASILVGPRGVGKTTYLLRTFKNENAFYLSLDNPLVAGINFYEFGDYLFRQGYDVLICDEVHYLNSWSLHLKALYDAHPKKKIIATDSSSLILRNGLGDLSRRFVLEKMGYLSFREYLYLKYEMLLPSISWNELTSEVSSTSLKKFTSTKINIQNEFNKYLKEGTRPYFLEGDYKERTMATVDKIIYNDIPFFLPEVKERHLQLMKNVIGYLATSPIPTLNIESLSNTWSVAKTTVYNLLEVMSQSGLIRIVAEQGRVGKTKGKKVFFADPTIYSVYDGDLGNTRESFVSLAADSAGLTFVCPKDDSLGDFIIDGKLFEVGGRSKKKKSAQFVIRDNIDFPTKGVIPMWMLGFL